MEAGLCLAEAREGGLTLPGTEMGARGPRKVVEGWMEVRKVLGRKSLEAQSWGWGV